MARSRTRITFEPPAPLGGNQAIYDGYAGLDWDNSFALTVERGQSGEGESGYGNVARRHAIGFGGGGQDFGFASLSGEEFSFRKFFAAAAWNDDLKVTIRGYRDGEEVALVKLRIDVDSTLIRMGDFDRDFAAVDAIRFETGKGVPHGYDGVGEQLAVDNIVLWIG